MTSYEEQRAFFDTHWDAMRAAAERGGGPAVIEFIEAFEERDERRVLYVFARQGLVMRDWDGKNLDTYVDVGRTAIETVLADDPPRVSLAAVLAYNLAADLADCWPGDDEPRRPDHFETGRRVAEDCIRWREAAGAAVAARAHDWWVKGMHELSLGDAAAASASWEQALDYTRRADDDFSTTLYEGYLGLARWCGGSDEGERAFHSALASFAEQLGDVAVQDDARYAIDQLEKVRSRYAP